MNATDQQIKDILKHLKKYTVLGLSADSSKASQRVPVYMSEKGYEVVGVNPGHREIAGLRIFDRLQEVPAEFRELVNVFRRPEQIPMIIDEILKVGGVKVIWLQQGISHPEAERRAEREGILVISDRCMLMEHRSLIGG